MNSIRAKRNHRGFSLAELLAVIAIMGIMVALIVPTVIQYRRTLRQKELDAKAEIIYTAVQNQLLKLRADGNSGSYHYADGSPHKLAKERIRDIRDAVPQYNSDGEPVERNLYYMLSGATDSVADAVMTAETVDAALLGSHWVIEFDPEACNVYAVFYSEDVDVSQMYLADWTGCNQLRAWDQRANKAQVGYYGGDVSAVTSGVAGKTLQPYMEVTNGEKLSVTLRCDSFDDDSLQFKLTLKDAAGHERTEIYTYPASLERYGARFYKTVYLDDLSADDKRFGALYGPGSDPDPNKCLTPGSSLTLTLQVVSTEYPLDNPEPVVCQTNSLFADDSTGTKALVRCARHLQNLDASSGVSGITAAEQTLDINFANDPDAEKKNDWYDYYHTQFFHGTANGTAKFQPIVPAKAATYRLESYDGGGHQIAGLNVYESGVAVGLFADAGGMTVKDVTLIDAQVSGGNAGALAGVVSGDCTIKDCRVYLNTDSLSGKTYQNAWISGANAGGLVGVAQSGTLSIESSFASTVIAGTARAGGLVGSVGGGTVQAENSYADSYISGKDTSGIAAGDVAVLNNCYAAGFQTATDSAAGLANGAIADARNSYTVCALLTEDGASAPAYQSTAQSVGGTPGTVYYFHTYAGGADAAGTVQKQELKAEDLGSAFEDYDAKDAAGNRKHQTVVYGLKAVTPPYPFPYLAGATVKTHYGDWQAEFTAGTLVYYERYATSSGTVYGFYGANEDLLQSGAGFRVTGDGYGVVFQDGESIPETVTVRIGGTDYPIKPKKPETTSYPVQKDASTTYLVYPLPAAALNAAPTDQFYQEALISYGAGSPGKSYPFNPHFARSVGAPDGTAFVRSARHLYSMSRYYAKYSAPTAGWTFRQERDVDYATYLWTNYAGTSGNISAQEPIGASASTPFQAIYDGRGFTIEHVSIISNHADNIGLFGYLTGELKNIALVTDYDTSGLNTYYVQRETNMGINNKVYMGILTGYNAGGTIHNCAVAGYYVAGSDGTLHAYPNSKLYAGGLVGGNNGSIYNSSADCPTIRVSAYDADVALGGLVGRNEKDGRITTCYAIGHIEAADTQDGRVRIAGFAGYNDGTINDSYCAVSLVANGNAAESYGFAPLSGYVRSCCYLSNVTCEYSKKLRSYTADPSITAGDAIYAEGLRAMQGQGYADEDHSYNHTNSEGAEYPYRAVVRKNGAWIHYGDWQSEGALGTMGVFYWEHEEGGSNDGYHLTFAGTEGNKAMAGTTLCIAHDDGGVITEFGYGYYTLADDEHKNGVAVKSTGIASSMDVSQPGVFKPGDFNAAAAEALQKQMSDYAFYPYTTRTETEVPVGEGGDKSYLYLHADGATYGTWTLSYGAQEEQYCIAPFFANAIKMVGHVDQAAVAEAEDGFANDFHKDIGQTEQDEKGIDIKGNPFEIRSTQQLQYLNWNYTEKSTDQLVNNNNYSQFPYLVYTCSSGRVTKSNAGNKELIDLRWRQTHDIGSSGTDTSFTPVAGVDSHIGVAKLPAWFGSYYDGQSYKIQNIHIKTDSLTAGLFGVTVGANIKNIVLYSNRNTAIERTTNANTGTKNFAYALGGMIAIAYEYEVDKKPTDVDQKPTNVIENCAIAGYTLIDTSANPRESGQAANKVETRGNIGGMIGLSAVNLERCSAVTDIRMECTHAFGHAQFGDYIRVGGMTGSTQGRAEECYTGGSITFAEQTINEVYGTSVSRPTEKLDAFSKLKRNQNVLYFVGGFSGGCASTVFSNFGGRSDNETRDADATFTNCYTYTKLPKVEGTIRLVTYFASVGDRASKTSTVTLNNCYYLDGIAQKETETPLSLNWYSIDDEKHNTPNNYAAIALEDYETVVENQIKTGNYKYRGGTSLIDPILVAALDDAHLDDEDGKHKIDGFDLGYYKMLMGEANVLKHTLYNDNPWAYYEVRNTLLGELPKKVTFEELSASGMPAALKGSWKPVTTTEPNGAEIPGKYSFPGNNGALLGKDFPFPTVVQQNDLTFGNVTNASLVNVHYGAWPNDHCYWENGRDNIDVFADMVRTAEEAKAMGVSDADAADCVDYAVKVFHLYDKKDELGAGPLTLGNFTLKPAGIAEIVGASFAAQPLTTEEQKNEMGDRRYDIPIRAKTEGAVTVTVTSGEHTASFVMEVTHDLKVTSVPTELLLYHGQTKALTFSAKADTTPVESAKDYSTSDSGTWVLHPVEDADKAAYKYKNNETEFTAEAGQKNVWPVTSQEAGSRVLEAEYTFKYHKDQQGNDIVYREVLFIPDHTLGVIGLGSGDAYQELWRQKPDSDPATPAEHKATTQPAGADFFLYETASDEALDKLIIDRVTIKETGGSEYTYQTPDANGKLTPETAGAPYVLAIAPKVETGETYAYRSGTLLYTGSGTPGGVEITVNAHFVMGEGTDAKNETYTLKVSATSVPVYRAEFASGATDATGATPAVSVLADGALTLPACGYARTGYTFTGWKLGDETLPADTKLTLARSADGTKITAKRVDIPGDAGITVDAPALGEAIVFTAVWEPDSYTLTLKAHADGTLEAKEAQYTVKTAEKKVEKAATAGGSDYQTSDWNMDGGWTLDGWYTARSLADGVKVLDAYGNVVEKNIEGYTKGGGFALTGDVTLYARWSMDGAFLPADELENGYYMILSNAGTGAQSALSLRRNTDTPDIYAMKVNVTDAGGRDILDGDGTTYTRYIPKGAEKKESENGNALWKATQDGTVTLPDPDGREKGREKGKYTLYNDLNNEEYGRYIFRSPNKDLGLNEKAEAIITNPNEWRREDKLVNYARWVYGKYDHSLECAYWAVNGGGDTVYLNGTWKVLSNDPKSVYLYKQQTIYTFD